MFKTSYVGSSDCLALTLFACASSEFPRVELPVSKLSASGFIGGGSSSVSSSPSSPPFNSAGGVTLSTSGT